VEVPPAQPDDRDRAIAAAIVELIPDRATVQVGIGGIPNAVMEALHNHSGLGIHTELLADGLIDLVDSGAATGTHKFLRRSKVEATFCLGTQRLYDWVDDNPMVEMRPADYTNDTSIIRRFRKMVAINSAIQIDLTGQVCADSIGSHMYSGVGGQMDFIRGAALAEEGRAIIALPATAAAGTVSRIVPYLSQGAGVVTTRAHVHTVVTEWGVAELHGRSVRERAVQLIAISDPRFRDELESEARLAHLI
jgi:acyl-CoA hydrolase